MAAKKESRPLVVRLTPPGVGAVAVVLASGPGATEIVSECFSPNRNRPLAGLTIGRIILGRWGGPEGEELIVCRRAKDRIEIHPHGGRAAVDRVVQDLVQRGAVERSWQSWVAQDEVCPIRADARIALAAAPTQRTAAILLDQFHGALRRDLEHAIAQIECGDAQQATDTLAALADRGDLGRHFVEPWKVVLAGTPNVGKSSLINALVGYERAVVYDQPGTTRDVVTARTAIDGWPIELSDTAGIRAASDALEAEGVRLAEDVQKTGDLVIVVVDATAGLSVHRDLSALATDESRRVLFAVNKVDVVDEQQRTVARELTSNLPHRTHLTSALTREGIDGLLASIASQLVPHPPAPKTAVPFAQHHREAIDAALASLATADLPAAATHLKSALVAK